MLCMRNLTVASAQLSKRAISLLERPCATSAVISRSRRVRTASSLLVMTPPSQLGWVAIALDQLSIAVAVVLDSITPIRLSGIRP